MGLSRKDIKIEITKGQGPGGQHRNKTSSTVKATFIPLGITVTINGRHQGKNKRKALSVLEERVDEHKVAEQAKDKKARRDHLIHNSVVIRTYDYSSGLVKDHRTGKKASLKQVMQKGRIDLLR
jgi:peptide chain release factor 1